jgi:EAL domain-containing protein (putative c-di-GMP-specific phosphodiesterase class I)
MSFSDAAMYQAKRSGRRVVAHTAADDVPGSPRFQILQEVRAQIERGVVRLEYQPQIDLGVMRTVGVEALVRFRSDELGPIPPDQAIPVIETNGLMVDFTTLVVRQAIDDALQLQRRGAFVQMSVNIAVSCLHSETFVQMLRAEVRGRCAELHRPLVLELTEEAMMYEVADVLPVLDSLRDDGCQIAMDDFGKGYSSIARLLQLPIDIIKFDKELIDGDPTDPATRAVVHSIAQLGTALGLTTLAEGTETADQVAMVRELGVDHCQGYFFSASMPVEELPSWIRTQDERHAAPGRTRVGPEPVVASKR